MAVATFPYISMLGYTEDHEAQEKIVINDDLSYTRYVFATQIHKVLNLVFKDISEDRHNVIKAFWDARKSALTSNDFEFFLFNPEETYVIAAVTPFVGRYVGIFHEPKVSFSHSGKCRFNVNIPVLLLATAYV